MKKNEFVKVIKDEINKSEKETKAIIDTLFEQIQEVLIKEGEVSVSPFGKFVLVEKAERKGRNPQTGADMIIPARKTVKFKPSQNLKESVK